MAAQDSLLRPDPNAVQGQSFHEFLDATREQPIYVILGVQGSGTNLLRSILAESFNFSVVQDQSLIFNAALKLGATPTADAVRKQYDFVRSRLFPTGWTLRTKRRIKSNSSFDGIDGTFDTGRIRSGADFARFIYAFSAYTRGTPLMAIKSDDLWETITGIDHVLPNRRVILLTRDFRDNLVSITRKDFGPVDPLVSAQYVKSRFAHYDREFRRTPHEHRLHVRYEDLLANPDAFVARLSRHFSLSADGDAPPQVDTGRIRRDNVKKWSALSTSQLAYCEAILENELQTYGYTLASATPVYPSVYRQGYARVRDAFARVPQKVGRLVRRLAR